jgi:serine/threonine protein kinase
MILDTPTYMSPEQARGKAIDRRTDIWAFGCVLYECLTGKRAFEADALGDLIVAILEHEVDGTALPAATPTHVRELLARALIKDPRTRLRDIGEARVVLEETRLEPVSSGDPRLRYGVAALAVAALVGCLLGVLGVLATLRGTSSVPAEHGPEPPAIRTLTFSGDDATRLRWRRSADGRFRCLATLCSRWFQHSLPACRGRSPQRVSPGLGGR